MALRPLAPLARGETYRALLFCLAAVPLGALGLALVIAGWWVTAALAITPAVLPLLLGLRALVGVLARAWAGLARGLLGTRVDPPVHTGGDGFWATALNVPRDRAFWSQQAYLLLAWPLALLPVATLAFAFELISLPVTYRWIADDGLYAFLGVDSAAGALPPAAVGLVVLLAAVHVAGRLAAVSRALASRLLDGDPMAVVRSPAEVSAFRLRALTIHAAVTVGIGVVLVAVWALTSRGGFWPVWALLPLALLLAIHAWVVLVLERPGLRRLAGGSAALAIQVGVSAALGLFLCAVWALTSDGYFWPVWPVLGLTFLVIVHAGVVFGRRAHRIETLETSRAGAVDVQEAELRRIERDLHDGAQARIVALGMSIGMAEEKLRTDPEAAQVLLAEARSGAREALEELRGLARGIHPPILADRGLEAAVAALAAHSAVAVQVSVDVPERPAPAVETAAYFVVAEALANAGKHAGAQGVDVRIRTANGRLVAEVVDDGLGGADPAGGGLTGLRRRVEALDGTLRVASPPGGPTIVRAELPCGS